MRKTGLFTNDQLKRLSNILDNAGQVLLATIVLTPFVNAGKIDLNVLALGIVITLGFWWAALRLERIST